MLLPTALTDVATHRASRGIAVFDRNGRECERRTFPEVLSSVQNAAGRWAALGVVAGDRLVISLDTSWAWIEAWLGAIWIGALPAAIAPPGRLSSSCRYETKLTAVVEMLGARYALVPAGCRAARMAGKGAPPSSIVVAADRFAALTPERPTAGRPVDGDSVCLQLTSGSTGTPRAVALSHLGIVHNALAINEALRSDRRGDEALVGWLPLHHDMGLIGYLVSSIVTGMDLWLFPPAAFIARPERWLGVVARSAPSLTFAPNFAFAHCVQNCSASAIAGMDLSEWRAAVVGAEMVRSESLALFSETFATAGFKPEALRPGYGLAEATLGVSIDQRRCGVRTISVADQARAFRGMRSVACVGAPLRGTEIRVIDSRGASLPEETVGEVAVRGPGVFQRYFNDPRATNDTFLDGWLRTGDLGLLREGELYVTGRLKDVLIVRGENVMPHEVEAIAEQAAGGGLCRSCSFSVAQGSDSEKIILLVEVTTPDPDQLAAQDKGIRRQVLQELSLNIGEVLMVRRGTIPRTSSGKVRRSVLREMYMNGEVQCLRRS